MKKVDKDVPEYLSNEDRAFQYATGFGSSSKGLPGFSPFAPVLRAGHYDHIPESLQPLDPDAKEVIHRHALEKSSSSFLKELATPPSTDSENEAGQMGLHILCFGKKKHHIDRLYKSEREADRLGYILLFFVILANIPALILQCAYVAEERVRMIFLENYQMTIGLFYFLICFSIVLKYFSGIMRQYPYNVIMCVLKSLVFAFFYTVTAAYTEYLLIAVLIRLDARYEADDERIWETLYEQYKTNDFPLNDKVKNPDGIPERTANYMFLYGIICGVFNMILMMLIVKYSRVSFFGAAYPFISYTLTFSLILFSTLLLLGHFGSNKSIVWELTQAMVGPVIGTILAEMYVQYLDRLLSGKLCPIKAGEYMYAMAHY